MNKIIVICIFLSCNTFSQNNIDSLLNTVHSTSQGETPQLLIQKMEAVVQNPKASDIEIMKAYNLISVSYTEMGEHNKSIEASLNMKKVADRIGSLEASSFALSNIADSYRSLNLLDEALNYYEQSFKIMNSPSINREHLKFNYSIMQYDIGHVEYLKKNYTTALGYFKKALDLSSEIKVENEDESNYIDKIEANFYLGIGNCYVEIEKYDSAEYSYKKAQKIIDRSNNILAYVFLLKGYGDLNFAKGNYTDAIDSAKKAENLIFFDDSE